MRKRQNEMETESTYVPDTYRESEPRHCMIGIDEKLDRTKTYTCSCSNDKLKLRHHHLNILIKNVVDCNTSDTCYQLNNFGTYDFLGIFLRK
jgi:hypothetical protein